ncbi:MAG: hypothetical protein ACOYON_03720 [Fimbriimonas sp.]
MSFGEKLQSLPKGILYLILILLTSVPLFLDVAVPNKPEDAAIDLYKTLMEIPEGSTILIASDWTNSTRGESGGQFESLMKILMRRNIKFAFYSTGSPEAPQVARDLISVMNAKRRAKGEKEWERFESWVSLGFLPDAEAAGQGIANNFKTTFSSKTDVPAGRPPTNVFESPVLKDKAKLSDFSLVIIVTASKTSTISIERFYGKVPIALMVTGVMGPESNVYYASGQVVGLCAGLKGLYDIENLMEHGINVDSDPQTIRSSRISGEVKGFPGMDNKGKGARYYPTLHFALTLLILAVIAGNVGMVLAKRKGR